jgi:hypothetical protein
MTHGYARALDFNSFLLWSHNNDDLECDDAMQKIYPGSFVRVRIEFFLIIRIMSTKGRFKRNVKLYRNSSLMIHIHHQPICEWDFDS